VHAQCKDVEANVKANRLGKTPNCKFMALGEFHLEVRVKFFSGSVTVCF
jgi:hypothetical protein